LRTRARGKKNTTDRKLVKRAKKLGKSRVDPAPKSKYPMKNRCLSEEIVNAWKARGESKLSPYLERGIGGGRGEISGLERICLKERHRERSERRGKGKGG